MLVAARYVICGVMRTEAVMVVVVAAAAEEGGGLWWWWVGVILR